MSAVGQTRPRRPPPRRAYSRPVLPSKRTHTGRPDRGSLGPAPEVALLPSLPIHAFTRDNGVWTQQAQLFNASGAVSVTLSADGNTAVIGAPGNNVGVGAAWVFTRSNGVWTQGQILAANDEAGEPGVGQSGAPPSARHTPLLGGPHPHLPPLRPPAVFPPPALLLTPHHPTPV